MYLCMNKFYVYISITVYIALCVELYSKKYIRKKINMVRTNHFLTCKVIQIIKQITSKIYKNFLV